MLKVYFLIFCLLLPGLAKADTQLKLECLGDYASLAKPRKIFYVDPSRVDGPKFKLRDGAEYFGKLPAVCRSSFDQNATLRVITDQGRPFIFELTSPSTKPKFIQYLSPNEVSRMEKSFAKDGMANAKFHLILDPPLDAEYTITVGNGVPFEEKLTYMAHEVTYE